MSQLQDMENEGKAIIAHLTVDGVNDFADALEAAALAHLGAAGLLAKPFADKLVAQAKAAVIAEASKFLPVTAEPTTPTCPVAAAPASPAGAVAAVLLCGLLALGSLTGCAGAAAGSAAAVAPGGSFIGQALSSGISLKLGPVSLGAQTTSNGVAVSTGFKGFTDTFTAPLP